ncbi:FkbM family methyltransferase [Nonomuraea sp. NPDC050786]|uniref:FkbM family methyltransferase n=1 Tax=Nonomuraea sp. NPDC050786 TaxID=3154840 RepID=UPI0034044129
MLSKRLLLGMRHLVLRAPVQRLVRKAALRGHIPSTVWRRLHPSGIWKMHAPDGTPFLYHSVSTTDLLARSIVWTDMRDWERSTQRLLFDLARGVDVFVDVGAYSGIYSILACIANPRLKVVAFEPNPEMLPSLMANIAANGLGDRVTVVNKALSSSCGHAELSVPSDNSAASLLPVAAGQAVVRIEMTTGDQALEGLPVGLVKMDVEGLETRVLEGMSNVIELHQPHIIAECLNQRTLDEVTEMARKFGYEFFYHVRGGRLVPAGDGYQHPGGDHNFLITPRPRIPESNA